MDTTKTDALDSLISQLDAQIIAIETLNIPGTTLLLTMARLDLQAKRHDIDDIELKALCTSVERALSEGGRGRRRPARPARSRRHVRLTRIEDVSGQSRHP